MTVQSGRVCGLTARHVDEAEVGWSSSLEILRAIMDETRQGRTAYISSMPIIRLIHSSDIGS